MRFDWTIKDPSSWWGKLQVRILNYLYDNGVVEVEKYEIVEEESDE